MNPYKIIEEYYPPGSLGHQVMTAHADCVKEKALEVADRLTHLNPDRQFIEEAAVLHDIGIFMTRVPELGFSGDLPYICHGYLGRELLEKKGLARHALVCERHIGVGIRKEEIETLNLPLPKRDMKPTTLEEEIIAYADKFFSKDSDPLVVENSVETVLQKLGRHGREKALTFQGWVDRFENHPVEDAAT